MDAFATLKQFAADADVCDGTVSNDCIRDSEGSFRVVSRLAEQPFVLPVTSVSRNRGARWPLESVNAVRIPAQNIFTREILGLFSDRVARGDAVQAGENSNLRRGFHPAQDYQPTSNSLMARPRC